MVAMNVKRKPLYMWEIRITFRIPEMGENRDGVVFIWAPSEALARDFAAKRVKAFEVVEVKRGAKFVGLLEQRKEDDDGSTDLHVQRRRAPRGERAAPSIGSRLERILPVRAPDVPRSIEVSSTRSHSFEFHPAPLWQGRTRVVAQDGLVTVEARDDSGRWSEVWSSAMDQVRPLPAGASVEAGHA
jgi:hypothetical protein